MTGRANNHFTEAVISPGLILAESLAVPRCFGSVRAYLNKISFCAPMF